MTDNRFFTQSQRQELFLRAKGKCQNCSCEISLDDFHADHITPYSLGGKTELSNGQALCRSCNLKKSASLKIDVSNWLPPGFELRKWQEEFLQRCYMSMVQQINKPKEDINAFILHAFPGSGKTLASLLIGAYLKEQGFIERIIVTVPSDFLRDQMEDDARTIGLHLNKKNSCAEGFDGIVTTYAKIGYRNNDSGNMVNAEILRDVCKRYKTLIIADECHHLGERKRWGECFSLAFGNTVARLMTSGTPFRSDRQKLPWVRYYRNQIELSPPHAYSYGYGITKWNTRYCALGDQVVRDVVIKQWNGVIDITIRDKRDGQLVSEQKVKHKLTDNSDQIYECKFDSVTGERTEDNRRLRKIIKRLRRKACIECGTEKHPHGTEYVRNILIAANDQLDECRRSHEWAGGLIICDSIPHADAVAKALKKWTNEEAVVVHSETGDDKRAIKNFKTNRTKNRPKWIIAVGKISEGVDIKFLRVGVYLTTIQASLRWTQILGRILRTESDLSHDMQTAYFYQYEDGIDLVPDDNGDLSPESVNIKLFAESLMDEKAQFESTVEHEDRDRTPSEGGDRDSISISAETHSASGKETHHIYDGQRIEIKELEKFKILTAKTGWPPAKLKSFIEKCGEDELRRVL